MYRFLRENWLGNRHPPYSSTSNASNAPRRRAIASGHDGNKPPAAKTVSNQPNSNAKMATEEERAKIMAEYLAGADEDDGIGDFDPDDEVRTYYSSINIHTQHPPHRTFSNWMGLCYTPNELDGDGSRFDSRQNFVLLSFGEHERDDGVKSCRFLCPRHLIRALLILLCFLIRICFPPNNSTTHVGSRGI